MFELMLPPLAACFILVGIHAYLGIHVVERKVIFVDLALAQIAALGGVAALLMGFEPESAVAYLVSLSFTFIGAAVFSLTRTHNDEIPQEAIIGVVYAVSASVAVLALSKSTESAEHLKEMMVGNVLFVTWGQIGKTLALYSAIGLFHFLFREKFVLISFRPAEAEAKRVNLRLWDFLFYMSFGFVVASSVKIAGVLLVFSFLIVPSLCGVLLAKGLLKRLLVGWGVGLVVSVIALYVSVQFDLPTGASVVATFGAALAVVASIAWGLAGTGRNAAKGGTA